MKAYAIKGPCVAQWGKPFIRLSQVQILVMLLQFHASQCNPSTAPRFRLIMRGREDCVSNGIWCKTCAKFNKQILTNDALSQPLAKGGLMDESA